MPTVMPVSELQRNFKAVIDRCEREDGPIYLTRNGSASVVVMSADAFDREMSIHEKVRDREIRVQKSIARGYEDYLAGRYMPLDQALAEADKIRTGQ